MGSVNLKLISTLLLLFFLSPFLSQPVYSQANYAAPPTSLDYWEKDETLWTSILKNRKILVSAKNKDRRTHSNGVGLAKAPVSRVWAFATDPEKIKHSSRFLKDFVWDQKTGAVSLKMEMLGFEHEIKGRAEKFESLNNPTIKFQVLEGSLVPFQGELEIRSFEVQSLRTPKLANFRNTESLVRISGLSAEDRELSWPLRVAMEALLQRTASALREAVEKDERSKK